MNATRTHMMEAIRRHVGPIAPHITVCANAIRYDLLYGPAWVRIPAAGVETITDDDLATVPDDLEQREGDRIVPVFPSIITDTLDNFLAALPSELFWEEDTGECFESEPEGEKKSTESIMNRCRTGR